MNRHIILALAAVLMAGTTTPALAAAGCESVAGDYHSDSVERDGSTGNSNVLFDTFAWSEARDANRGVDYYRAILALKPDWFRLDVDGERFTFHLYDREQEVLAYSFEVPCGKDGWMVQRAGYDTYDGWVMWSRRSTRFARASDGSLRVTTTLSRRRQKDVVTVSLFARRDEKP